MATLNGPAAEAVSRYLRHIIWRKGLLVGSSPYFTGVMRRGYANLMVITAMICDQAARRSAAFGAVGRAERAIIEVERDYVLHAGRRTEVSVQERINRHRHVLQVVDSFFHQKAFARSMVGPVGG